MGINIIENKKAIFFDRDGVINQVILRDNKPFPPLNLEELQFTEGIENVLQFCRKKNYLNIVVTNQPDAERGQVSKELIEEINDVIIKRLPIDKMYVCWDERDGISNLRKPKPGMILKAVQDFKINISNSFMIGDRWKDINAGHAAGCKTIFLENNYDEKLDIQPDFVIDNIQSLKSIINND